MKYNKGQAFLSFLIIYVVSLIVLSAMYPIILSTVTNMTSNPDIDPTSKQFLSLIPAMIALVMLVTPLAYLSLRRNPNELA